MDLFHWIKSVRLFPARQLLSPRTPRQGCKRHTFAKKLVALQPFDAVLVIDRLVGFPNLASLYRLASVHLGIRFGYAGFVRLAKGLRASKPASIRLPAATAEQ